MFDPLLSRALVEHVTDVHRVRSGGHFEAVRDQDDEKLRGDVEVILKVADRFRGLREEFQSAWAFGAAECGSAEEAFECSDGDDGRQAQVRLVSKWEPILRPMAARVAESHEYELVNGCAAIEGLLRVIDGRVSESDAERDVAYARCVLEIMEDQRET